MAESEIEKNSDRREPSTVVTSSTSQTWDGNRVTRPLDEPAPDALPKVAIDSRSPDYLDDVLKDAELLLKYAAETGIDIAPDIRDPILQASTSRSKAWNEEMAANLLTALTALAAQVNPVTAESLRAIQKVNLLRWEVAVLILALIIGTFSVASFVASGLSSAIRTDIATDNELTVKLTVQLGRLPTTSLPVASAPASNASTPPQSDASPGHAIDVITELQQFASTIRAIDARARQLNWLVCLLPKPNRVPDPFAAIRKNKEAMHTIFELPDGLPNFSQAASDRIRVYQEVRYFAQNILDEVSLAYGAITACVLPVLYALLGTSAYLFRSYKLHIRNKTYIPSFANSARFIIGAIGGAVVGLFNNFSVTQGATMSPLAVAFLVGYAVDVFYTFLDALLQNFIRNTPGPQDAKKPERKKSRAGSGNGREASIPA